MPTAAQVSSTTAELQGLLDLAFDPLTQDLVDSDDGFFVETSDSRTAVLWQMQCEVNAWWGDASQGSRIRALLRGEVPGGIIDLVDAVKECLQPLVNEGVIVDLTIALDEDEAKRPVILLNYRDRSTGTLVDVAYVPFNL